MKLFIMNDKTNIEFRILMTFIYGVFLCFFQSCCFSDDGPPQQEYELRRYLALKDTNDVIEVIRYKESQQVLMPNTRVSSFPLSHNTTTTAFIKRKSKTIFDTLEIKSEFDIQYSESRCSDGAIWRTDTKLTIVYHTLNKVSVSITDDNKNYIARRTETYTLE